MSLTSERGQVMKTYLPRLYERSRVIDELLQVEGVEFDELRKALNETLDQFFIRTATWGLDTWEEELGLPPAFDQPDDERRDRIISRLRGIGTATIRIVKEVAESYDRGAVNVIEDFGAYTVTIQFVDTSGVPPNLSDLQAAVRAILPAHLAVQYEFNFFLWDEWDALGETWDEFDALGLTWDELEVRE